MKLYFIILILVILITFIFIIVKLSTNGEMFKIKNYYNQNIRQIINSPFTNMQPKDIVIPLNIFQTWKTKELKPGMQDAVDKLKATNPEFKYYLYDDNDCREFIKNNFEPDVLTAFDCLIPGAYKADLWRYCILYKYGGVYLDIKFTPVNGFKLINLMDREHFCLDTNKSWTYNDYGLYNAIMITKPNNIILKECIDRIVLNVKNKYYGISALAPTGPILLGNIYNKHMNGNIDDIQLFIHVSYNAVPSTQPNIYIVYNKHQILEMYPTYKEERGHNNSDNKSYGKLWEERAIYKDCFIKEYFNKENFNNLNIKMIEKYYNEGISNLKDGTYPNIIPKDIVIPLNIFQTWKTKELKPGMQDTVDKLKATNPEFKYYLYDNNDCREFIKNNFEPEVLTAFDCLIPGAYKADLWRYCVLYKYGGVYLDIKFIPVNGFKLINLMDREQFCFDRPGHSTNKSYNLYNAIIATKPNNNVMKECIDMIVENVKNKYYGYNPLYPTGPGLLGDIYFNNNNYIDIKLYIYFSKNDTNVQIIYDKYPILEMYDKYREEQGHNKTDNKNYDSLWRHNSIYKDCFTPAKL